MTNSIHEPARDTIVIDDVDLCVLGGSCTGVFAAVRAARLGLKVILVEKSNAFGGTATNGLVNHWHTIRDTEDHRQIIGGLSVEVVENLVRRGVARTEFGKPGHWCILNPAELAIELDSLVLEHLIRPLLHTMYCAPAVRDDGRIEAVFVENKNGRSAIRAKVFIDATGDGDLAAGVGLPFDLGEHLQPPTTCGLIQHWTQEGLDHRILYNAHRAEFDLPPDNGWHGETPPLDDIAMAANTHVFDVNGADADQLTAAEIEGRRRLRAFVDLVNRHGRPARPIAIAALCSHIGLRETRRFRTEHVLTEEEVLNGVRFDDAIANGSYRVDVHHRHSGGFLFKCLDGTTMDVTADGITHGRWRPETAENPTFYQIPYRTMIHRAAPNLLLAGRMIGTDNGAFGAVRVMINLNQVGEAAGVAAALAVRNHLAIPDVPAADLRAALAETGSVII